MKEESTSISKTEASENMLGACLQWLISPRGGNNFYSRVLNGCSKRVNHSINSAQVTIDNLGKYVMEWNPTWFATLPKKVQIMVLVHEAAHLILGHIPRMLRFLLPIKKNPIVCARVRDVLNVAADLCVNDLALRPLTKDLNTTLEEIKKDITCWPENLEYPTGGTMEDYIMMLLTQLKNEGCDLHAPPKVIMVQQATGNESSSGDKHDEDYPQWFKELVENATTSSYDFKELLSENSTDEIERAINNAEIEARSIVKRAVEESKKSRGTIPNELKEAIDLLLTEPTVPWIELFKTFFKSELSSKTTVGVLMPNIMLLDIPNLEPYPGTVSNFKLNIAIGIDTSGSVSDTEFKEFLTEVYGMVKGDTDIHIKIFMFDALLQQESELNSIDNICNDRNVLRCGYGGTSFEPFIRLISRNSDDSDWIPNADRSGKPLGPIDLAIIMTDGYAPVGPPHGPLPKYEPNCPLLWVLTPTGQEDMYMQKKVIRINR